MIKFKSNYLFSTVCLLIIFTLATRAQTSTRRQANNKISGLTQNIRKAIYKGYQASVLMWEIDAETGARMSAQFSGVVVNMDGVILSAAHVVMPHKTYKVMFPDGRECVAKGLGRITIPPTFMLPDAAMLQITTKGTWPFAEMGWSSQLKINTPCVSIAYPETQEQRKPMVRFGSITLLKNEYGFLQSSCVMEPGDSGGPLFDLAGRVIGIHSGIQIPEEINYEVPIDTYRKFWKVLSMPVNYTTLPSDSVTVTAPPFTATAYTLPTYTNLHEAINLKRSILNKSCVKIKSVIDGISKQILATVLSTKGLKVKSAYRNKTILLSKSSMVGDSPEIALGGGNTIKASVIARSKSNDLVLLCADRIKDEGIVLNLSLKETVDAKSLGSLLISPRTDSLPRLGVIGSGLINLPKLTSYGYLGATTDIKNDKLVLTFIQPGSAAQVSDLQVGDVIQSVDGEKVEDSLDFLKALKKYSAGDTTLISISREGKQFTRQVVLKYPPQKPGKHPAELFTGGKSIRRDGFDKVFLHDSAIRASECGGPIVDVEGYFLGINIARLSRTSTVAVTSFAISQFVTINLVKN